MAVPALESMAPGRRWLLAVAAPAEGRAVLQGLGIGRGGLSAMPPAPPEVLWQAIRAGDRFDLLVCGVGKANAAGAVARVFDGASHAGVLNLGVAGSLPGSKARLTQAVLASMSLYADEGVLAPDGFTDVAAMGFPPDQGAGHGSIGVAPTRELADRLAPIADWVLPIATVSTCSGTDTLADQVVLRTSASAEAMEGAAIGFTCLRLRGAAGPVPFAELRTISNTTGDRPRQQWDLRGALARLSTLVGSL